MNRIAHARRRRARYVIRDAKGRYLWRHWSGEWRWTFLKADARVFRNQGSAERRAGQHAGANVVPWEG